MSNFAKVVIFDDRNKFFHFIFVNSSRTPFQWEE